MILDAVLCLAIAAAVGGDVGDEWVIHRGDPGLRGIAGGRLPDRLGLLWTHEVGEAIVSSPVLAAGRLYFGADDGRLRCLRAADGGLEWSFEVGEMIDAPPLYCDGLVCFGSSDGRFFALDAEDGALRWQYETDAEILGSANWLAPRDGVGTRVVVGSYDATLYCFDAASGELVWRHTTKDRLNGTPAVIGDTIVIGGCDTILYVLSGRDGESVAEIPMGEGCHIAASVGYADGRIYFGHYGNEFVCLDLESHEVVWRHSHPSQGFFAPPAIGDDQVVFGGRDKRLHCVDRDSGEERWSYPARRKIDGGAVICGDRVVFTSGDGQVRVLRLDDGEELWAYDIGTPILGSPAVAGGRIYIGANDGRMYAFGATGDETEDR